MIFFNETCDWLMAKYRRSYIVGLGNEYTKIASINDDSPVFDVYSNAVADNIVYLATGNADSRTLFIDEANSAYDSVWADMARNTTMTRRCRWNRGW